MSRRLLSLLALAATAACGGSSSPAMPDVVPAGPSGDAAAVAIDGWTDRVVDARLSPAQPARGTVVTVTAPGYLTRQQTFDGTPVALWPAAESYVDRLVYGWDWQDGTRRMVRWDRPFTVSLDPDLAGDADVVARVEEVLGDIRRRTGLQAAVGSGGEVTIGVDPALARDGNLGEAHISTRGAVIVSGRVRLVSRSEFFGDRRSNSPHTLLHELGHVVGLSHSARENDVMAPGGGARTPTVTFTAEEASSLHMMYAHRRPGNLPVDREAGLAAAAAVSRTFRIVD